MLERPAAKLGAYAAVLALAVGGGALVGAAVGPAPSTEVPAHVDDHLPSSTTTTTVLTLPAPAQREQVSEETAHHG
jgi:hypothetical protein